LQFVLICCSPKLSSHVGKLSGWKVTWPQDVFLTVFSLEAEFIQMKLMPSSSHSCEYVYM